MTGYKATLDERLTICNEICKELFPRLIEDWATVEAIKKHYFAGELKAAAIQYQVRDYFGDLNWRANSRLPDGVVSIVLPDEL